MLYFHRQQWINFICTSPKPFITPCFKLFLAMWNYVQPTLENMDEYVIMGENLEEGMEVIVSGNLNLAHEAPVRVIYDL